MSETIYISRKCEYCHELLILLHQNRDTLKFPVVDVHKSPYPKAVTSVPCMVIDDKVLPGEELFKFINYLISQNSKPKEVKRENDLMPRDNPKDFNEPIMQNGQRPNNTGQIPISNAGQGPMANAGPMHNGNPLSLNQSSQQKNLNVPGNMKDDMVKQNEPNPNIDEDEMFPGFCVGGVCELGFSSLEDEKDITMDNTFEILDSSGDIEPQMDEGNTKSEKAKLMDDDYSRMMKERGNDLSMKVN